MSDCAGPLRSRCRECLARYNREWTARNRERTRQRKRRWREANPDKMAAARKSWSERNHQAELDKGQRYRSRKRGGYAEKIDRLAIHERDGGICGICHESVPIDAFELDHFVPVSWGGPHIAANVRVTHRHCNRSRGNRLPLVLHDPGPIPPEVAALLKDLVPGFVDCGRKGMWMVGPLPERGLR